MPALLCNDNTMGTIEYCVVIRHGLHTKTKFCGGRRSNQSLCLQNERHQNRDSNRLVGYGRMVYCLPSFGW